jgi:hypothetical protein
VEVYLAATDAEIDRLVYDLYGLTAEEIAKVEEAIAGVNPASVQESGQDSAIHSFH